MILLYLCDIVDITWTWINLYRLMNILFCGSLYMLSVDNTFYVNNSQVVFLFLFIFAKKSTRCSCGTNGWKKETRPDERSDGCFSLLLTSCCCEIALLIFACLLLFALPCTQLLPLVNMHEFFLCCSTLNDQDR